ncbi:thiosulfate sulfurtransferase 18 [Prosopis cineraria]|uniref:thiosulfate sulfurtransferase 18 n=1 Tax=Prosopis cineraria TaxID=364024 RepID=UPI00240F8698|nr:thiosulfate sulfurtransferase 18 [Prosopis cineraria]
MNLSWSLFTNGFILILLYFIFFSNSGAKIVTLDVHEAKTLIQSGHVFLDVRTVENFQKGHVDADKIVNIPYLLDTPRGKVKNPEFLKQVSCSCDKEDHIIVGCDCGVKSLYATADLQADGFKDVRNMEGGYRDWVKDKFPVKTFAVNQG